MKTLTEISKFLSLVLRHRPEALGVHMDAQGWVEVQELVAKLNEREPFDRTMLEEIVRTDNKQRYSFNADRTRIRANQGHSIQVDLGLTSLMPPDTLYHGTADRFAPAIERQGLLPMQRQYVHLSADVQTALTAGRRHGKPRVYVIDAAAMARDGHTFYRSENGVWLTDAVPYAYMRVLDEDG